MVFVELLIDRVGGLFDEGGCLEAFKFGLCFFEFVVLGGCFLYFGEMEFVEFDFLVAECL